MVTGCLGYNRGCSEEMSIQQLLIFFLLLGIFVLLFSLLFIFLFFLPRQNDPKPRHWAEVSSLVTDCSVFAFGRVRVLIEVHLNNGRVSAQLSLKKAPVEEDLQTIDSHRCLTTADDTKSALKALSSFYFCFILAWFNDFTSSLFLGSHQLLQHFKYIVLNTNTTCSVCIRLSTQLVFKAKP